MVNATELRIGNKLIKNGTIVTVSDIYDCREEYHNDFLIGNYEDLASYPSKEYEPIHLTPEILIKWCGFDKKTLSNNWITLGKYIDGSYSIDVDGFTDQGIGTSVTYLHELQNAYFVLQKEELPIKLPDLAH